MCTLCTMPCMYSINMEQPLCCAISVLAYNYNTQYHVYRAATHDVFALHWLPHSQASSLVRALLDHTKSCMQFASTQG